MSKSLFCLLLSLVATLVTAAEGPVLENADLILRFNPPEKGMGCVEIAAPGYEADFTALDPDRALLWQLRLSDSRFDGGRTTTSYSDTGVLVSEHVNTTDGLITLNNLTPAQCSWTLEESGGERILHLYWREIEVPDRESRLDVECVVTLPQDAGRARARLRVELNSAGYALESSSLPCLGAMAEPGSYDLVLPRLTFGAQFFPGNREDFSLLYPSIIAQMPFLGLFRPGDGGIYFGFHDPAAAPKGISVSAQAGFNVEAVAADAGVNGKSRTVDYEWLIAPCRDRWQAARIYHEYALRQPWTAKGRLRDRADVPRHARDIELWVNIEGTPAEMKAVYDRVKQETSAETVAVHYYGWNIYPFDTNYPEDFPARDGFEEVVRSITANGDFLMPYLNGHTWDSKLPSYPGSGVPAAAKNRAGGIDLEHYGSTSPLAPMCPTSEIYAERLRDNCRKLAAMGVNAVYLDQVGQLYPVLCYDGSHGHELGGGGHWSQGYREMLAPLLEELDGAIFLATENAAEPFIDTISHFLVWTEIEGNDMPGLVQVYNNYARYFGALSFEEDDIVSFAAAQKRTVLWGLQPGWMVWLYGREEARKTPALQQKIDYLNQAILWRRQLKSYLDDGELIRDIDFAGQMPEVTVQWHRMNGKEHAEPLVSGAVWRSEDRSEVALVFANIDTEERTVTALVEPEWYEVDWSGVVVDGREMPFAGFELPVTVPALGFAVVILSGK